MRVTSAEDVRTIETLARRAMVEFPEVSGVSLHCYNEKNLSFASGGGATRGRESTFKTVSITRDGSG